MTDCDVTRRPDGKWQARAEGAARPGAVAETQAEAQKAASDFARSSGGGEVRIHRTDGKIRDSNTIGKNDPFPPRGKRHLGDRAAAVVCRRDRVLSNGSL